MSLTSFFIYRWLLASAAFQSKFLGTHVYNRQSRGSYDFIIVGGGTAGCTLASRLSEIPQFSVLLLERGNSGNDFTDIVLMVQEVESEEFEERFRLVPNPVAYRQNPDRTQFAYIGNGLGGGSTHNNMQYSRGSPLDQDQWAEMGAIGWSFNDMLPFFKKLETFTPVPGIPFDPSRRGFSGPIHSQGLSSEPNISRMMLEGAQQAGYPVNDYDSFIRAFDLTQTSSFNGVRSSTRRAYLLPAQNRPNLDIVCQATVTRILFENKRAVGVEYERSGIKYTVYANKEVILSASAFRSPQLLMLSGIGPAATLGRLGIPLVQDLPGVGQDLQDHSYIQIDIFFNRTFYDHYLTWQDMMDFDAKKKGPLIISESLLHAELTNSQSKKDIDVRLQFEVLTRNSHTANREKTLSPLGKRYSYNSTLGDDGRVKIDGVQFNAILYLAESRGYVTLNSTDPHDQPIIDERQYSQEIDILVHMDILKKAVAYWKTPGFQSIGIKKIVMDQKGLCTDYKEGTDPYYRCIVLTYARPGDHYAGTAKIGLPDNPMAVVNPSLQVYGVSGLRVIDASVMPRACRGNNNIPVIAVAEKAADIIKAQYGVSRATVILPRFDDVRLLSQALPPETSYLHKFNV